MTTTKATDLRTDATASGTRRRDGSREDDRREKASRIDEYRERAESERPLFQERKP